jgi:hypothetical protein
MVPGEPYLPLRNGISVWLTASDCAETALSPIFLGCVAGKLSNASGGACSAIPAIP